jgi:aldehyde:ferredoxin oxidoreductase
MGSKNLKAIAVTGTCEVKIAKSEEFLKVAEEQKKFFENKDARLILQTGPDRWIAWGFQEFGTGPRGNWEACDWAPMYITRMDEFASTYGHGEEVCGKCPISHFTIYEVPGIGRGGAKVYRATQRLRYTMEQ